MWLRGRNVSDIVVRTEADTMLPRLEPAHLIRLSSFLPSTERREERVGDWRNYMHKTDVRKAKKAKKNLHVLG